VTKEDLAKELDRKLERLNSDYVDSVKQLAASRRRVSDRFLDSYVKFRVTESRDAITAAFVGLTGAATLIAANGVVIKYPLLLGIGVISFLAVLILGGYIKTSLVEFAEVEAYNYSRVEEQIITAAIAVNFSGPHEARLDEFNRVAEIRVPERKQPRLTHLGHRALGILVTVGIMCTVLSLVVSA
jgi:hypothetical protein